MQKSIGQTKAGKEMKKALMVREELERFLVVKMSAYSQSVTAVTVVPLGADGHDWNWDVSKITGHLTPRELEAIERKIIRPLQRNIELVKDDRLPAVGESPSLDQFS